MTVQPSSVYDRSLSLQYATQYRQALLKDVLPFWEKYSLDGEYGGYLTCLDRRGLVFDTDKFIWLQNRQVWTFSMLVNQLRGTEFVDEKICDRWLKVAQGGASFLSNFGRDPEGNWYFSLDRQGQPLIQPYNIFSDCFAAMAFSQYALACHNSDNRENEASEAAEIALQAYQNVLRRKENPKGKYTKAYPGTRPMKSLAVPMILANLTLEMDWLLEGDQLSQVLEETVNEVMTDFWSGELLYENVAPDGSLLDCFEGRVINPGHGLEAMWFMLAIAERQNDPALMNRAVDIALKILDFGWDEKYGGIFYFLDTQGHPPQQLEWDQKLWWVHLETLVMLVMGYRLTGRDKCWQWYQRVHDYAWSHFADPEAGEWFGYLNRQGEVLLNLKGGKWKGCFHVPRALYLCWQEFLKLENQPTLKHQE